ncbi:MAG: FtsQ-type POTRA domain-containing protein [Cellvibrionales bacterium TMED148]|nr:cell division protein FtsQ [Porticoccaceae bacterium]RPG89943.1 MAG: FtsQ-type POTRA domain-containing protein [Cellvibrionales bacterium TMED148]
MAKLKQKKARGKKVKAFLEFEELIRSLKLLIALALLITSIAVTAAGFRNLDRPLTNIVVKGKFSHLDQQVLISILTNELQGGFLSLDLRELKLIIETHPWIRQVTLTRQWPSTLTAEVSEEVPIARWGKHAFLNYQGKKLEMEHSRTLKSLPELQSPFVSSEQMMQQYQVLTQQIASTGLIIERLVCDSNGLWSIFTSEGFELIVGRDQLLLRMRRFVLAWNFGLDTRLHAIKRVDLRYPNGLAVSWKNQSLDAPETRTISYIPTVSFVQRPA